MAITADTITTRFPGVFDALGDTLIGTIISEAENEILESVWGASYDLGLTYLTAHIATYTTPGGGAVGNAGPVTKRKVGDVELVFGAISAAFSDLQATPYGQRFLQYRRWVQGGAKVAAFTP